MNSTNYKPAFMNNRKRYLPYKGKKKSVYMQQSKLNPETKVICSIPIKKYNSTVNLFASRSRLRNTSCTRTKISKYHILESKNTGRDICLKILDTDIGFDEHYENINFYDVIPVLSPILELFKNQHNRFNYLDKLKYIIANDKKNKQKYNNQISVPLLQSFFNSILHKNVPSKLFGTSQNLKVIKRRIAHLLRTVPKKRLITSTFNKMQSIDAIGASLDMQPLFNKFNISKIEWLRSVGNNRVQWIIILKLLHWFFTQYIIKILHKYVVLISFKGRWVYITKDDWCKMQEKFLKEKESAGSLVPWTSTNLKNSTWNIPIGTYKFIPSSSGLRAVLRTKYDIKDKCDDIDVVLRFLQQLYVTYFNENGMPTVASCIDAALKFKSSCKSKLYYVRCDIQDAFGSIMQEKLYDIICTCCRQLQVYFSLRVYTLPIRRQSHQKNGNQVRKVYKKETVQFLPACLKKSIHKNAVMNKEKPRLVKITRLMAKIKKLIFQQKVKLNGKIYLIKFGVPQGMPVSPILSNIYYQHMFKEIFSIYTNNGLLCTYVDDILYITESEHYAAEFLEIVKNGIPSYNVKFNPNKIQSNVGFPYKPTKIKFLGQNITL